ncbi:hypothetical protein ACFOWE_07815 [Planomonospora corallina]|uniref:DUF1877 domain-containing protein n=1 Tax=Planomonospora corallina TaxID=1806052 RepID=A0ABV8I562_9ACTN
MAVTQQLARISGRWLDACRTSVDELVLLCSFGMAPAKDHLDLDWAPGPLLRIGELVCVDPDALAAFRCALDGDEEVNPAYRDHPQTVWEHPVTALEPAAVAVVAPLLRRVGAAMMTALAASDGEILAAVRELLPDVELPREYMLRHLTALLDFYDGAAERGLAVVLWWD